MSRFRASLLKGLAIVPVLLFIPVVAAAQGSTDDKTAIKLLKGSLKEIEKAHKDAGKGALTQLGLDLAAIQDGIVSDLAGGGDGGFDKAGYLSEIFDAYREFARASYAADVDATNSLAETAGQLLNDNASGLYPAGFVIGDGADLDRTMTKVENNSEKNTATGVKRAKRLLGLLEKEFGYLARVAMEISTIPAIPPVVAPDGSDLLDDMIIDRRAFGPTIDLIVAGRDPNDETQGRLFVGGAIDENQILFSVEAELTGPGFELGGPIDATVDENNGRWSAVFEALTSNGLCNGGCGLEQGNYVMSVIVDGFSEVTRAVGMP